jgi:acyl-CoA synthetase (AMP-forming)/AMP-acid ligase II
MKQFHDYVKDHAERMPDKIALTISGRKITYRALDELACVVARQLTGTGMAANDRVALHAPTSIETIACALGVMKAGFVLGADAWELRRFSRRTRCSGTGVTFR